MFHAPGWPVHTNDESISDQIDDFHSSMIFIKWKAISHRNDFWYLRMNSMKITVRDVRAN